jgi:DNA-binding NtrC family response regulator
MPDIIFQELNPLIFLQTFIIQDINIAGEFKDNVYDRIEFLGLTAACCFEKAYRKSMNIENDLNLNDYAEMIIAIKNKIGGNFSRTSSDKNYVGIINTRCPFGDAVKLTPQLCKMTSSVFGGIAANNFGYSKVVFKKRIAAGDKRCEMLIFTDPSFALNLDGDEFHKFSKESMNYFSDKSTKIEKIKENWCFPIMSDIKSRDVDSHIKNTIVASSKSMCDIIKIVKQTAATTATILITGETGVGKEVIARTIHNFSLRRNEPFIAVNCGAIPENLVESALFGHEKGAFTGAYQVHHGFFERACGGTLFLDEVDSLPLYAQVKLLRVLQEKEFERVGGKSSLSTDVRIIAACNGEIEKMVTDGRFRRDLYYRINVIHIHIPPLRLRQDDISPLITHFLNKLAVKYRRNIPKITDESMNILIKAKWPGNIRELENILERSFLLSRDGIISEEILTSSFESEQGDDIIKNSTIKNKNLKTLKKETVRSMETQLLEKILMESNGNIPEVAKQLGISTRAVYKKLKLNLINPGKYRH